MQNSARLMQLERRICGNDAGGASSNQGAVNPSLLLPPHNPQGAPAQQQQSSAPQQQQQQQQQKGSASRRKRSTPEQRQPSVGAGTNTGNSAAVAAPQSGAALQPGASLPRQPLEFEEQCLIQQQQGGQGHGQRVELIPQGHSNHSRGAKRARNSSPIEQQPQNFSPGGQAGFMEEAAPSN